MELSRQERMSLMRFVCNAAWGDVEVQAEERRYVMALAERFALDEEDLKQVERWLKSPPPIDSVDPTAIPDKLRALFLSEMEAIVAADGVVTEDEADLLTVVRDLLGSR